MLLNLNITYLCFLSIKAKGRGMSYIYVVCLALIIFFSISLLQKKRKSISEKILAVWIVLAAITEFSFFGFSIGLFIKYPLFFSLVCDTYILHGTFLFFYVKTFYDPGFKFTYKELIHFLPMFLLSGLKVYLNLYLHVMDCFGEGCLEHGNRYVDLLTVFKLLVLGIYIFLVWRKVHENCLLSNNRKGLYRIRYNWIKNILIGVGVVYVFSVSYKIIYRLGFDFLGNEIMVINMLVSLFILVFFYMGNSYAYIFVPPYESNYVNLDYNIQKERASSLHSVSTTIDNSEGLQSIELNYNKLESYIKDSKPYLNGQVTIKEISNAVHIPQNEISQLIQVKHQKYYVDYMNGFRVEALKQKLDDPNNDSFTIFSLALDCGFASKTSFNRIFKSHTGKTPSEYRKNRDKI